MRFGNCVFRDSDPAQTCGGFSDNEFRRAVVGNCKDLCVIINVTGSVCVCVHAMGLLYERSLSKKDVTPSRFFNY